MKEASPRNPMTKRKCCELAREDIKNEAKWMGAYFDVRSIEFSRICLKIIAAEAHLRYCAANDKTEETE